MRTVVFRMISVLILAFVLNCSSEAFEEKLFLTERLGENHVLIGTANQLLMKQRFFPRLGVGVNEAETETFVDCIRFNWPEKRNTPFRQNETHEQMVHSGQELSEKLELGVSLQAKAFWGRGELKIANIANITITENAFNWLVWQKFELDAEDINTSDPSFQLSKNAQEILDDPSIPLSEFFKMCGTHFYSGQVKGGLFMALYQVNSKQQNAVNQFSEEVSGKIYVMEGDQKFSNYMKKASYHNAYDFSTYTVGGDDSERADVTSNDFSPRELRAGIKKLGEAIHDRDQGIVMEWHTTSYQMAFKVQFDRAIKKRQRFWKKQEKSYPFDGFKEKLLSELFQHFKRNQAVVQKARIQAELLSEESYEKTQRNQDIEVINHEIALIMKQNEEISALAQACLESNEKICTKNTTADGLKLLFVTDFSYRMSSTSDWLLQWNLWFQPEPRDNELGETSTLRLLGFYNPLSEFLCQFHSSSSFLRNNKTADIAIEYLDNDLSRIHYVIGQDDKIYNNVELGLSRPLVCAMGYKRKCQLYMSLQDNVSKPKSTIHDFVLTVKIFDEFGFLVDKSEFFPVCS